MIDYISISVVSIVVGIALRSLFIPKNECIHMWMEWKDYDAYDIVRASDTSAVKARKSIQKRNCARCNLAEYHTATIRMIPYDE